MVEDLLYANVGDKILARFPSAEIYDASDEVHAERIQVKIDISEEDWWRFLITENMAVISFHLLLISRVGTDEKRAKLLKILKEVRGQ